MELKIQRESSIRYVAVLIALLALSISHAKDRFDATEFVRQQLKSTGSDQARAVVKNRVAQGAVTSQVVNGGPGVLSGKATFFSEGEKIASLLEFPPTTYHSESFVGNDRKASVAQLQPGVRSELGLFIMLHNEILTEGLCGGTLSTAWALSRWKENNATLQNRGLKKVDGRELHRVDYIPKKGSDLEIQLYFEPDTYRHVMTVYIFNKIYVAPPYTRLEERFADFKSIDNLILPGRWTIEFLTLSDKITRYDVTEEKISQNVSIDPRTFDVR
jgi:hypothetical protein